MKSSPSIVKDFHDHEIWQNLLNSLPVGIFLISAPDARPVFMNNKAIEILEHHLDPDANISNLSQVYRVYKYGTDEFYESTEMPITAGLEGRLLTIDDMEIRLPDGKRKLLFATGSPVFDEQGNLKFSIAAFYDITEESRLKQELKRNELRLSKLVENASDVLVILNPEGKEAFISDSSLQITGYTPEELMQVGGHHFISPDDLPRIQESFVRLMADKDYIFHEEYSFRHKNGKWLNIEAYARNFIDHPSIHGIVVNFRDNTEKKETEKALLKSLEFYRYISEHVPVGIFRFERSADGVFSFPYFSNTVFDISGKDAAFTEMSMNSLTALVHPDHQKGVVTELHRSENTLSTFRKELLFQRKEEYVWIEAIATPVLNNDGSITWDGVVIDINEKKKTELTLASERERLKNVIEGANAGTWELNFQTNEIILNKKFSEITNFTPEEKSLIPFRRMLFDLVHPEDVKTLFLTFKEHYKGNSDYFETEIRVLNQSKSWIWVLLKGKIITLSSFKNPEWVFGTIVNIHQRKLLELERLEAERQVKESERKYRELFESSKDGIVRTNMDGYILDANNAYITMLGYNSLNELTGTYKDYTPGKWCKYEQQIVESQVLNRGYSDEYEKEYIRKDGSVFPISMRTWLITVNGEHQGMWAIVRDISEQKRTEKELRQMLRQVESFNQHQLNAREEERAAIASSIHDELGQAMTALKLDLGWVLDNLKGQSHIRQKLLKMMQLADSNIREVQRISSELRPSILDNLGLVAAIEWYCNEFQQRSRIHCNFNLTHLPEIGKKAELALFRIIQEALTNVIRHSKASTVDLTLDKYSDEILLHIADNGLGISENDLYSSKSFGLTGMRERASYLEGRIEFINNSGTTVKVSIPLKNALLNHQPQR